VSSAAESEPPGQPNSGKLAGKLAVISAFVPGSYAALADTLSSTRSGPLKGIPRETMVRPDQPELHL
jgi:hypothetical protein